MIKIFFGPRLKKLHPLPICLSNRESLEVVGQPWTSVSSRYVTSACFFLKKIHSSKIMTNEIEARLWNGLSIVGNLKSSARLLGMEAIRSGPRSRAPRNGENESFFGIRRSAFLIAENHQAKRTSLMSILEWVKFWQTLTAYSCALTCGIGYLKAKQTINRGQNKILRGKQTNLLEEENFCTQEHHWLQQLA